MTISWDEAYFVSHKEFCPAKVLMASPTPPEGAARGVLRGSVARICVTSEPSRQGSLPWLTKLPSLLPEKKRKRHLLPVYLFISLSLYTHAHGICVCVRGIYRSCDLWHKLHLWYISRNIQSVLVLSTMLCAVCVTIGNSYGDALCYALDLRFTMELDHQELQSRFAFLLSFITKWKFINYWRCKISRARILVKSWDSVTVQIL